jgi:hypothetical protein
MAIKSFIVQAPAESSYRQTDIKGTLFFQVCDVISRWETALREKGMGKFENKRVIRGECYKTFY